MAETPDIGDAGTPIRQGYLALDGSVSVRVRDAAEKGYRMTIKGGDGRTRTELEWPIDKAQFEAAWVLTEGRRVCKRRHRLPLGEHVIELDVFEGELEGFRLAEVEFDSEEAMDAFAAPPWFGREVSDDERYTNASLALYGLKRELWT